MKKILFLTIIFSFSFLAFRSVFAHCNKEGVQCPDTIVTEKQKDGTYVVHQDDVKLFSKFPMRYDPKTESFYVTTGNGKEVQVKATPKKAEGIAIVTGMLTEFEMDKEDKKITFLERDGKIFYEIKGKKSGKLFGIWPVSYDVKAEVGEDGKLASFEKPWILKILKYFIK